MDIKIKRLTDTAIIPEYAKPGDSGFDLCADLSEVGSEIVEPGIRSLVPTGLSFEIPEGYELQIRPRSGLALKNGITVINSPGTVDSSFRGMVSVILINNGPRTFVINHGDRIAQGVIAPVIRANLIEVDKLSETERGAGGFGHTGV